MNGVLNIIINKRKIRWLALGVIASVVLAIGLSINSSPASADALRDTSLCGNGAAPDYGFTYNLQQAHWTVGWQNYTSEQTVIEVDNVLDELNAEYIAQTMILILPQKKLVTG